jgi:probable rRNA maturation factor
MPALDLTIQGIARFSAMPVRTTLARWITSALERDAELVLRFVDVRESRRLNHTFRGQDYVTDVLTFEYAQAPRVQADIVICPPLVRRAARARGLPFRTHLAHLVIHATLHAQGYEHDRAAAATTMETREVEILARLGFGDPYAAH